MKKIILIAAFMSIICLSNIMAATLTLRPNAQGSYSGWGNTGCSSGSSEWRCVDEDPVNISDYLYTQASNTKESFAFANTGFSTETINSVTLYYYTKRYSSSRYTLRPLIRINSTDYFGNASTLGADYTYVSEVFLKNPGTGNDWTISEVEGLEAGMDSYTPKPGGYVAQVYAVVDYNQPDLKIDNLSLSKSSAYYGEIVTVTVVTKNIGSASAGASTTRVANGGNHDFSVGVLAVESTQIDSFNYTCGASNVTFTATADINSVITESNEANNQLTNSLECIANPDLIIQSLSFSKNSAYEGEIVTLTVVTKNIGSGTAGESTTRVANGEENNFSVASLAPGVNQSNSFNYTCGASNVTFTATADINSVITESNEANNQQVNTLECRPKSDLIIDSISFLEYIVANKTMVNVTTIVKNNGTSSVSWFYTRLNTSITYPENAFISGLEPWSSKAVTKIYNCTAAHDFVAIADITGRIPETDETNNQLSTYIDCII